MARHGTAAAAALLLVGCSNGLPAHVELKPDAENVEIMSEAPESGAYALAGEVRGQAAATDLDVAQQNAQNDLRNKAAALGATIVTIDQDLGEAIPLTGKTKVTLIGRAYKSAD